MKKICAIAALCLLTAGYVGNAAGELDPEDRFSYGLLGGGSISWIAGESVQVEYEGVLYNGNNTVLGGGFVGGLVQYWFTPSFSLRADLYYGQQGTKLHLDEFSLSRRSHNVNLPVYACIGFLDRRINLMIGPQFGFCAAGFDAPGNLNNKEVHEKVKWASTGYYKFDIGASIALEGMFTDNVGIFARFNAGFLNVFKAISAIPSPYGKNMVAHIGFGYKFD